MPPRSISHKLLQRRMRRTMNYGNMRMDTLTIPLSEMVVDYFDKHNPFDSLDIGYTSKLAKECCVDPTTLIVAMIYVERLRCANRRYFIETSPEDIYLSALMIASKYLQDSGQIEYIWNDEWAQCSSKTIQRVNELELEILTNIDWNLQISENEFKTGIESVEQWVALYSIKKHKFFTYNDLTVLVKNWEMYWSQIKIFCTYTGAISATYLGTLYFAVLLSGIVQQNTELEIRHLNDTMNNQNGFMLLHENSKESDSSDEILPILNADLIENDFENKSELTYCSSDVIYEDGLKDILLSYRLLRKSLNYREKIQKAFDHSVSHHQNYRGIECF